MQNNDSRRWQQPHCELGRPPPAEYSRSHPWLAKGLPPMGAPETYAHLFSGYATTTSSSCHDSLVGYSDPDPQPIRDNHSTAYWYKPIEENIAELAGKYGRPEDLQGHQPLPVPRSFFPEERSTASLAQEQGVVDHAEQSKENRHVGTAAAIASADRPYRKASIRDLLAPAPLSAVGTASAMGGTGTADPAVGLTMPSRRSSWAPAACAAAAASHTFPSSATISCDTDSGSPSSDYVFRRVLTPDDYSLSTPLFAGRDPPTSSPSSGTMTHASPALPTGTPSYVTSSSPSRPSRKSQSAGPFYAYNPATGTAMPIGWESSSTSVYTPLIPTPLSGPLATENLMPPPASRPRLKATTRKIASKVYPLASSSSASVSQVDAGPGLPPNSVQNDKNRKSEVSTATSAEPEIVASVKARLVSSDHTTHVSKLSLLLESFSPSCEGTRTALTDRELQRKETYSG